MANPTTQARTTPAEPIAAASSKDLSPTQVRARVIGQHDFLRGELAELGRMVERLEKRKDASAVSRLKARVTEFLTRLEQHMDFEEIVLQPMLMEMDPARPTLVQRMREDHLQQRALFRAFIEDLHDGGPDHLVARVRELSTNLLHDMECEERVLLNPDVLRDDAISIGQEDG